jgi:quercetin dioxygenase-like cupin family protein
MTYRTSLTIVGTGLALLFAGAAYAADPAAPTENKGLSAEALQSFDISKDYSGTEGRQLRMRKITLAPGGVAAYHTHKDRPSISYVLAGEITDHREGEGVKKYTAGQSFPEPTSLNHWVENTGKEPAVLVGVDIFHQ